MNDNVFAFENSSSSLMDYTYMDELLLDGCWLQAANGSIILNNNTSASNPFHDPPFQCPKFESNIQQPRSNDPEKDLPKSQVKNLINPQNPSEVVTESRQQWWIAPMASSGSSLTVMERLIHAISYMRHYMSNKNALIQIWLPETRKGNKVLSTSQKLFTCDLSCPGLFNYRNVSESYHFRVAGDAKDSLGLPGRVFMQKVPEWTPDVRLFKSEEYARVSHAQEHDVRGSFAVPVFDQDVKNCVGVVEVVMTTQKSKYSLEIRNLCKALEVCLS
ncbi:hypothetical protein QVD17_28973 [Tagetes erecta]|uniref:NLP1-9 GAF domain-containing protein n=1 Tax=Tagetes erecta TaxID=13708 RepID=A0AAD8NT68_TARER|nr:hypothetical protein QVD17_28973 [Tagetes erecta]